MSEEKTTYTAGDLALLIPTKDRPQKLANLLESIAGQTETVGRVIVVDGGESVQAVTDAFKNRLNVDYYTCRPPGQIRQRNLGIANLREENKLVGFLDDDLVFEPGAIEAMIACWNRAEPETAGIGFNIVNTAPHQYSPFFGLLLMDDPIQGRVLPSGGNVPFHNISEDVRTQWLGGGYTVWRRQVLLEYPQSALDTRWAQGEDLRYSYPIGKKYPLWVSSGARVRHEHVYDQAPPKEVFRYRGRISGLALFYFIESHAELSRLACLWMVVGSALARVALGVGTVNGDKLRFALGQAESVWIYLKFLMGRANLEEALAD